MLSVFKSTSMSQEVEVVLSDSNLTRIQTAVFSLKARPTQCS